MNGDSVRAADALAHADDVLQRLKRLAADAHEEGQGLDRGQAWHVATDLERAQNLIAKGVTRASFAEGTLRFIEPLLAAASVLHEGHPHTAAELVDIALSRVRNASELR